MLTFAEKVKEMTRFMKEAEDEGTMPTQGEIRRLVKDFQNDKFDKNIKTVEEYRQLLNEMWNYGNDEPKETKTKSKEVAMKKKAPSVVVEKLLDMDLIESIITDPKGEHYYFDSGDKELSAWIAKFMKNNKNYNKMTVTEFNNYLTELEGNAVEQEEEVVKYEVTPEEVAKYTTPREVAMHRETQREECRMSPEEVMALYERVFILYHTGVQAPVRRKIKEITIKYMTSTLENNGKITYQPILREGRIVSMILGGYELDRIYKWIDKKAERMTKKNKLYSTDGAKLKAMSANFYKEYADIAIKNRKPIMDLEKETEGKRSTIWWYIVMGIEPEDYRALKFPNDNDTIQGYIDAHKTDKKERKPRQASSKKVKKQQKKVEKVLTPTEEAEVRYSQIRKGLRKGLVTTKKNNKALDEAQRRYEEMKKELSEAMEKLEQFKKDNHDYFKKAAGETKAKKAKK